MQGKLLSDRYVLAEEIGKGGMGSVYRAVDLRTGGSVAIKIPHAALAGDQNFLARLQREARIAARLYSPRVVRIIDVNEDDDRMPYLVMEYVPGPTLGDELHVRGRLPWSEALGIALEVARALDAADQNNIVHRDLKPHNIKLIDGEVKVLDFGIARSEGEVTANIGTMFMATPEYCAPERLEGLGDIRADIYALGVMLFEMLAGYPPFTGRNPMAVMEKHSNLPPPPLPAEVPGPVAELVQRCLEKQPEDRYLNPRALIDAITEVLGMGSTINAVLSAPAASPRPLARTTLLDAGVTAASRLPSMTENGSLARTAPLPELAAPPATAAGTTIAAKVEDDRSVLPAGSATLTDQDALMLAPAPSPARGGRRRWAIGGALAALVVTGAAGLFALRGGEGGTPPVASAETSTAAVTAPASITPAAANTGPAATATPTASATATPRPLPTLVAAEIPLSRGRNAEEAAVIAALNGANRFSLEAVRMSDSRGAEAYYRGQALVDTRGIVAELQRLGRYAIDDMSAIELLQLTLTSPTTARLVTREQHTYDEYSFATGAPVDDPTRHFVATFRWTYDLVKMDGRWFIDRMDNISEALSPR